MSKVEVANVMNNKNQMENIWHHIRKNPSRRTMRSFLKWRAIVWVVLLGLFIFCTWQGAKLRRLNADIRNATLSIRPAIDHQLKSLLGEINAKKHQLAFLEEQALSSRSKDLISLMTVQAETSKTQIIGVEHLKERQMEKYIYAPVKFTLRGDYNSLGRLINLLERSKYPMKLDYLSIATQEGSLRSKPLNEVNRKPLASVSLANSPESLITDIVLCSLRSPTPSAFGQISAIGEPTTKVQEKEQSQTVRFAHQRLRLMVSAPPQSKEQRFNHIGADFVYPIGDGMRDVFQRHYPEVTPQEESMPPPLYPILTGVIYNEHNPLAILIDRRNKSYLVRVNDTILDFTVLKIEPRSVILNRGDTQIELRVFKDKEFVATGSPN